MRTKNLKNQLNLLEQVHGGVGAPMLLWFLGVPGGIVFFLWLFFFRS